MDKLEREVRFLSEQQILPSNQFLAYFSDFSISFLYNSFDWFNFLFQNFKLIKEKEKEEMDKFDVLTNEVGVTSLAYYTICVHLMQRIFSLISLVFYQGLLFIAQTVTKTSKLAGMQKTCNNIFYISL